MMAWDEKTSPKNPALELIPDEGRSPTVVRVQQVHLDTADESERNLGDTCLRRMLHADAYAFYVMADNRGKCNKCCFNCLNTAGSVFAYNPTPTVNKQEGVNSLFGTIGSIVVIVVVAFYVMAQLVLFAERANPNVTFSSDFVDYSKDR